MYVYICVYCIYIYIYMYIPYYIPRYKRTIFGLVEIAVILCGWFFWDAAVVGMAEDTALVPLVLASNQRVLVGVQQFLVGSSLGPQMRWMMRSTMGF